MFGQQPARDSNVSINEPMEPHFRLEGEAPPSLSETPEVQIQSGLAPPEPIVTQGAIDAAIPSSVAVTQHMPVAATQGASPLRRNTRVSQSAVLRNISNFESVTTTWPQSTAEARKQSITADRVSLKRSLKKTRRCATESYNGCCREGGLAAYHHHGYTPGQEVVSVTARDRHHHPCTCFHHGERACGWDVG